MKFKFAKQSGVGLVEVLVALLVFSIGMLGVASLQVVSKKSSYEAQQRQEAVLLANEMVSRMKNTGASYKELYTNYDNDTSKIIGKSAAVAGSGSVTACAASAGDCSISQMATHNFTLWKESLSAAAVAIGVKKDFGLLKAKGCVDVNDPDVPADPRLITVTVSWLSMSKIGSTAAALANNTAITTNCRFAAADHQKVRHIAVKTYL